VERGGPDVIAMGNGIADPDVLARMVRGRKRAWRRALPDVDRLLRLGR